MLTTSRAGKNRPRPLASKQSTARRLKSRWNIRFPISTACLNNVAFFPQPAKSAGMGQQIRHQVRIHPFKRCPLKSKGWTGTGDKWTEVKNNRYWNQKNVHLTQIDVQVVKDTNTALDLYHTGKLDDATLTGQLAAQQKVRPVMSPPNAPARISGTKRKQSARV